MSNLTYNDIYVLMNDIIRSEQSEDVLKKTRAFNEGAKQLLERMAVANKVPGALLERDFDLASTSGTNFVTLPDDHLKNQSIWKKSGNTYLLVDQTEFEFVTLEELMKISNSNFMDTSAVTNFFSYVAMDDDKMYFDQHFASSASDDIRIWYYKYMADVVASDAISITGLSADFTVGETITGTDSTAEATVISNTSSEVLVASESVSGTFQSGEVITGGTSSSTATTTSTLQPKTQELELTKKYNLPLANAASTLYLYFDGSIESQEKDIVLDNLVKQLGSINRAGNVRLRPGVF